MHSLINGGDESLNVAQANNLKDWKANHPICKQGQFHNKQSEPIFADMVADFSKPVMGGAHTNRNEVVREKRIRLDKEQGAYIIWIYNAC